MKMLRSSLLLSFVFVFVNILNAQPHRLPPEVYPVLGCWFWHEAEFESEGYKKFIDLVSEHSPYNLLTTSLRAPLYEVSDKKVHDQIKAAAIYARERGVPIVMDLDVRLARRAFQKLYPDELQQMLILQEAELTGGDAIEVTVKSHDLSDHYTHRTTHYIPLDGSLMRVYAYQRNEHGINPATLRDITQDCRIIGQSSEAVSVVIPSASDSKNLKVSVMAACTHLTPDVFAPHIMEYQRWIIDAYKDVPLAGVCKDEWGFPPCFDGNPAKDQFWYSSHRAEQYAEQTSGRVLLFDCLLMSKGVQGREAERIAAINHFMQMSRLRNGAIEQDFYQSVKETFGASALVATHPTWWPYPDSREFKKNGLDWWIAKRDIAQTDEMTPFAVRTALAKKWNSPVWYNMFYSDAKSAYQESVWSHTLAGGRINYHPIWPRPGSILAGSRDLLRDDLMIAESRVRLLNYITKSPLDCPVAVVFGHACSMNWAGPAYDDVGMDIANALWRAGYPADLIPGSEIDNHSLIVNNDGMIQYGPQTYSAVILYHPEFEKSSTARFFRKAAQGRTALLRIGDWSRDFDGQPLQEHIAIPESMKQFDDPQSLVASVCQTMRAKGIESQSPATGHLNAFGHTSSAPRTEGFCRLIDGTVIHVAGAHSVAGDAMQKTFWIDKHEVTFDATGLAAIRLDHNGKLEALAAGALQRFKLNDLEISLTQPVDLALWKDQTGKYHGVAQNLKGPLPETLLKITDDWRYLSLPSWPPVDRED